MGNKTSTPNYDGLPPPIIPLDSDGKKKKKKKEKKDKHSSRDELDRSFNKKNSTTCPPISQPAPTTHLTSTLFRSPRRPEDGEGQQLSKVILPDQDLDIKVYKKSRDSINEFDRSRKYRSLPRSKSTGFRKSTDTLLSCESKQTMDVNKYNTANHMMLQQRCNSFAPGNTSFNSRWSYVNGSDSPTFKPAGLKGITFPNEETILKHASIFEKTYMECFVDHYYSSLPDIVQMSAIIIAYKRIYGQNEMDYRPISLRDYFLSEDEQDIPTDITHPDAKRSLILAVPDVMISGLVHLKGSRGRSDKWDQSQVQASIDLVRLVTLEAAKELSRIYEYQLAVVSDAASVQILGKHAAERSAEYLRNGNRFVEKDSLVEGTTYLPAPSVSHRNSFGSSRSQSPGLGYISAIFGEEREQRWEVSHVFASCGLRLDGGDPTRHQTSPVFMTSRDALPLIYGYRSPICKKDFETGTENITQMELAVFPEVLQDNPDDFHRDYIPLRVMISNRSSSFDSQSICSLSTDHRRYDDINRNGRCSRQSSTILAGHGQKVNGFSRVGMRTSTLAPNGKYGSLARSMEFDKEHQERGPTLSKSFHKENPVYQSERPQAVGGRFQKYSNQRPERITVMTNGDVPQFDRGTMRRTVNGNGMGTLNRQMNGSIHSLSRNPPLMGGEMVMNGTLNRGPSRQIMESNYMINGNTGSMARLPPRPPTRSVSNSQFNNHLNVPPSHMPNHHLVAPPMTAPLLPSFSRLPPTTETSFDCNLDDVAPEPPKSANSVNVNHNGPSQSKLDTMDFMDFRSFLKLVENQNANLKSLDNNSQPQLANGRSHLETDFPEVEEHATSEIMSNVVEWFLCQYSSFCLKAFNFPGWFAYHH